jgi:hypothetical protein
MRMKRMLSQACLLLVLALLPAIIGCSKVTQSNLDKVKSGMTYTEVIQILGKPTSCNTLLGGKSCTWRDGEKSIQVQFLTDTVVFFSGKNLGG